MGWNLIRSRNFWRAHFPGIIFLGTVGTVQGTASANAVVKLCPGGPSTVADGGGAFVLRYVPKGTYRIISYNPQRTQQAMQDITVNTNQTTSVTFSYSPSSDCGCP